MRALSVWLKSLEKIFYYKKKYYDDFGGSAAYTVDAGGTGHDSQWDQFRNELSTVSGLDSVAYLRTGIIVV